MLKVQFRVLFHHAGEALVALPVGRHHQLSGDLQDYRAVSYVYAVAAQAHGIGTYGTSCLYVVTADESRVVVGGSLAL